MIVKSFVLRMVHLIFQRETRGAVLALGFASAVSVALVLGRMMWAFKLGYSFLAWNLVLAWIPLLLALGVCNEFRRHGCGTMRLWILSSAWLVFFPNAPYILTDLVHLRTRLSGNYWVDLVLILTCAVTGLIIGLVSLFLMHSVVKRLFGQVLGWLAIMTVTGVSGLGLCIGRFLRFNSWDVVLKPLELSRGVKGWGFDALSSPATAALPFLFAAFLFTTYLMLYAVAHLPSLHELAGPREKPVNRSGALA